MTKEQVQSALRCWFLTGPTASGKTTCGIDLAEQLGAEIISLDSMSIYRGMDVGTAKPTAEEQAAVPHHLLDVVAPDEEYSLSRYIDDAHECIQQTRARGKEVLFVGGTPLYLKSLLRGIFEGPPADQEFRQSIEEEVKRVGNEPLVERLRQVDPLSAAKLHPNDTRRIIRALEVYKTTGTPISHLQLQFDQGRAAEQCRVFALEWERAELHRRIEQRVDRMFDSGLLEEVRNLIADGKQLSFTAMQAVGYQECIGHLRGERTLDQAIERTKTRTRQFARRQETWFRGLSECRRIPLARDSFSPPEIAQRIYELGLQVQPL